MSRRGARWAQRAARVVEGETVITPRPPRQPRAKRPHSGGRRCWQPLPQHLALIGKWSDREVAVVAGVSASRVRACRERLGLPLARPEPRVPHGPPPPTTAQRRQLEIWLAHPDRPIDTTLPTTDEARAACELLAARTMTDREIAQTVGLSHQRVQQIRVQMGLGRFVRPPRPPPGPPPRKPRLSERMRKALATLPPTFRRADFAVAFGPSSNHTSLVMSMVTRGWLEAVEVDGARRFRRTAKLQDEIDTFGAG